MTEVVSSDVVTDNGGRLVTLWHVGVLEALGVTVPMPEHPPEVPTLSY